MFVELCVVLVGIEKPFVFLYFKKKKIRKIRKRKKGKKIVWFAVMSLIYTIFTCFIVIFENLVELWTLV